MKTIKIKYIVGLVLALSFSWCSANETVSLTKGETTRIILHDVPESIAIADSNIADVQVKVPNEVFISGNEVGETMLLVTFNKGKKIEKRPIVVMMNINAIKRAVDTAHPNLDIKFLPVNRGLMIRGMVPSNEIAEDVRRIAELFVPSDNILNLMKVKGPAQINLRVKIVELSKTIERRYGINWDGLFSAGAKTFQFNAEGPLPNSLERNYRSTLTDIFPLKGFSMNAIINVLEKEGLATILSEPNLTALSGDTATFLAGGEFPIPVPKTDSTTGSGDEVTISFKEFGVRLAFTPTLIRDKLINLHVKPEVSQLSTEGAVIFNNFQIPSLQTRRAETTVELNSGESFIIAGLLQSNILESIQKFPKLSEIPVLKKLFQSEQFQRNESELVIIVTPYLVNPVLEKDIALPTDELPLAQITKDDILPDDDVGFMIK